MKSRTNYENQIVIVDPSDNAYTALRCADECKFFITSNELHIEFENLNTITDYLMDLLELETEE